MELKVKYIDPKELKPYERNAKKHPADQVEHIANSIREFGFKQPIVADMNNVVVIGHGRLEAAKKLNLDTVPVVYADDLSEEQIKALRLADNKTNESEWDLDFLDDELAEIFDIDMSDFGFDDENWFENRERNEGKQEGNEEYNEFVEKFEPKKTTDDCYTPDIVYDAVCEWVENEYGVKRSQFVRPFFPGSDYQKFKYPEWSIVVDNPPFSILSQILQFYDEKKIKFFLFAPALTLFSSSSSSFCAIGVGNSIIYENGASVATSFLTNLENGRFRTAPELYSLIRNAVYEYRKEQVAELPRYSFPPEIVTSSMLSMLSKYGQDFRANKSETSHIRAMDNQKKKDKVIFGSGYLISEAKAAEKAAAEKAAAEKAAAEKWELSEREKEIVKGLG